MLADRSSKVGANQQCVIVYATALGFQTANVVCFFSEGQFLVLIVFSKRGNCFQCGVCRVWISEERVQQIWAQVSVSGAKICAHCKNRTWFLMSIVCTQQVCSDVHVGGQSSQRQHSRNTRHV